MRAHGPLGGRRWWGGTYAIQFLDNSFPENETGFIDVSFWNPGIRQSRSVRGHLSFYLGLLVNRERPLQVLDPRLVVGHLYARRKEMKNL
jgi:hypothetical protein